MMDAIRTYSPAQCSHRHDDYHQIIISLNGQLHVDVSGNQGHVSGPTLGLVSMGENHAFCADPLDRFLVLDIARDHPYFDHELLGNEGVKHPFFQMEASLQKLVEFARLSSTRNAAAPNWLDLWQNLFLTSLQSQIKQPEMVWPTRFQKTLAFIEANLHRQIKTDELAQVACLSTAHFHDLFVKTCHQTPQDYLRHRRIEKAKHLIYTGERLVDIANDVGFTDQSSFGRAFRQITGQSPAHWRKSQTETKKSVD